MATVHLTPHSQMVLLVLRSGAIARAVGASARPLRRHSRLLPRACVSSSLPGLAAASSHPLLASYAPFRGLASEAHDQDASATNKDKKEAPAGGDGEMVYEAPLGRSVRLMKGVSLTSCLLTSVGMPTVTMLSEQSASVIGKVQERLRLPRASVAVLMTQCVLWW